ncbi:putative GntR-family regulatory protein [Curtobacterium citreum]|uniref:PLP-dependent aminotransferase family protein n=1 Tax=Curtobacterium citreum TaxID=2036 RepID=A0ABT2HJ35_9MICO|nr:PLP-dependent aminotransferase family protein [Curtobacterium citreum]MCS6523285.1 PLP-dependent aminotransferase family protein [Curtobacterium citreum]TQJ26957.1 GntR family transcriptional regulator [Curtobacterium citreum]GGL90632.1 putative GntR-family regulatory protein [Curtobacterium citreum]
MTPVLLSARSAALLLTDWRDGSDAPAYEALSDALRVLVIDGRVPLGVRLPAERGLAEALGVSRTTVANAYARLRSDGFLVSLRGSGSVVHLPRELAGRPDPERLGGVVDGGLLDLRKAALHAAPEVAEAVERAVRHVPAALAGIGYDTVGDPGLRAVIAERYTERGLPTDPSQIVVTIGAQHAIALLARVLVRRGDAVLVESPTYPHAHEAFREAGGRLVGVPVDAHTGWDASALETTLRRTAPAVAYVMPELHNPTGATMPAATRERLLATAAATGTVVVADETMGELRIDGSPELPLAASAVPSSTVVMIGSAAKVFWGGLRIGWVRAEPDLLQRMLLARPSGDLGTPVLDQLVARELVPRTAAVLEARRTFLRAGRDDVVGALRTRLPEWDVPSPAGGLTTWVGLGRPVSSALVLAARAEGVVLASGGVFGPDGGFERFLRVPFTTAPADRERMVDVLERAWARIGGDGVGIRGSLAAVV